MSRFTEARNYGWPSLRVSSGPAELVFVPMLGGRLMGIRLGGDELLWVNPELAGLTPDLDSLPARFPLWGGEKTWIAPQSSWRNAVPSPDLDSGPYEAEERDGRLILTSAVCRCTGLQIVRKIDVGDDGSWTTRHTIRNRGDHAIFVGPWTVMMINRPSRFFVPVMGQTVYMQGRPTSEGRVGSLARVDCRDTTRFKTGHHLAEGWFAACISLPGEHAATIAQFCSPHPGDGRWAHGHPAEIYNADLHNYCEMELHGPARTLSPDSETSWTARTGVAELAVIPDTETMILRAAMQWQQAAAPDGVLR